jgi:predicted RecB family nuclease
LRLLSERGAAHEQAYVQHLRDAGIDMITIAGSDTSEAIDATTAAMLAGVMVIVQGALTGDGWSGRPDILHRVATPSDFGNWSYEAIDTKLARETKAGTVLQLCLYSDLLTAQQGVPPEYMHVVAPWQDYEPHRYRFADYAAYYRRVKHGLREAISSPPLEGAYPEPIAHCDVCR